MIFLYNLFLVIYSFGIRIVSVWNRKAKLWVIGRKNSFQNLQDTYKGDNQRKVWMHCASLGEFEQGRPVLKKIIENYPDTFIVITFFSPSGYEIARNDKDFRQVYYMPLDSPSNARELLDILKPEVVLWVKYEYWHYYLQEIKRRNIPLLLVSGVYQPTRSFLNGMATFTGRCLNVSHIFLFRIYRQKSNCKN